MKGAQISVVNIGGKVRGLQLGVINIADSVEGASIGIFNFVGDGYHRLALWSSDLLPTNLGFKLGSKHVYTLFGFGVGRGEGEKALYGSSLGLGVHIDALDRAVRRHRCGRHPLRHQRRLELQPPGDEPACGSTSAISCSNTWPSPRAPPTTCTCARLDGADHAPGLGWFEHINRSDNYEIRKFPGFHHRAANLSNRARETGGGRGVLSNGEDAFARGRRDPPGARLVGAAGAHPRLGPPQRQPRDGGAALSSARRPGDAGQLVRTRRPCWAGCWSSAA